MNSLQDIIKTVFNIDENTSATIIITLFVFVVGIIIHSSIRIVSKYMKRINIRKMFLLNLHDLQKKSNHQAEKYKATASQFDFNHTGNFALYRIDISQLEILKEIGYTNSYNAFFSGIENIYRLKNIYRKAFTKMWEAVFALKYWQEKSEDLTFFNKTYASHMEKRNQSLKPYHQLIDSSVTDKANLNNPDQNIVSYFKRVNSIHYEWQQLETPYRERVDVHHQNVVLKHRKLNMEYQRLNIPILNITNTYLLEASSHFTNLSNLLKTYKEMYNSFSLTFRKHSRLINKGRRILNNRYC